MYGRFLYRYSEMKNMYHLSCSYFPFLNIREKLEKNSVLSQIDVEFVQQWVVGNDDDITFVQKTNQYRSQDWG